MATPKHLKELELYHEELMKKWSVALEKAKQDFLDQVNKELERNKELIRLENEFNEFKQMMIRQENE